MNSNFSNAFLTNDTPKDHSFQAGAGPTSSMNTLLSMYDANTLRQLLLHAQIQQQASSSSSSNSMEQPSPATTHSTISSVLQQIANDVFNPLQPSIPEHHHHNNTNIDCNPIPIREQQMAAGSQSVVTHADSTAGANQFQQQAEEAGIHHHHQQHQEVADMNMGVFEPVPLSIVQAAVECSIHQNNQTKKHELLHSSSTVSNRMMMPPAKKQKIHETLDMTDDSSNSFRAYQAEQWTERFQELWVYCKQHGHCQVPHTHVQNPALARWVKRQRYQY
jgi:hypothetical protein